MADFTMPEMGADFTSGTVAKVLVEPGETIEEDQSVLELETDKAVQEIPATLSGKVGEIYVKNGDKIMVGDRIFAVETGAAESVPPVNASAKSDANAGKVEEPIRAGSGVAKAPTLGGMGSEQQAVSPSGNGATSTRNGSNGASGSNGSSDSAPHTMPAVAAQSQVTKDEAAQNGSGGNDSSGGGASTRTAAQVAAAPSVRRLARELDVDITKVSGSGKAGRVSFGDVKSFLQRALPASNGASNGIAFSAAPLPDFSKWGETERTPMSGIRKATADQMARSWNTIPHVTQFDKADITELENLRKQFAKKAEAVGGKLTVTAIALKVAAAALKKFPQFNASIDMATSEIVLKKYVHIGVAVDTDRGLLVPVIRDVDQKNILELTAELAQVSEKARSKKTSLADMQGGCFTITNLGSIGGTAFTPIVNSPEVAILGMARGGIEPVWNGSSFEPRQMLPLSLSYDHRAIDGADGARFLRFIASALEQPFLLSLEG